MIVVIAVCLMLAAAVENGSPLVMRYLFNGALAERSMAKLTPTLALLGGLYLCLGGIHSFQGFISGRLQHKMSLSLKNTVTAHLLKLPEAFFDKVSSGYLAGRVMEDVRSLCIFFGAPAQSFAVSVLNTVGALVMLFIFSWQAGLFTLIMMPFLFAVAVYFGKKHRALSAGCSEEVSTATGKLQETLLNIKVVKSAGAEKEAFNDLSGHYDQIYRINMERTALVTFFHRLMRWLPDLCRFAVLVMASCWVIRGRWQIGDLTAAMLYVTNVTTATRVSALALVQMTSAGAGLHRLNALLGLVPEENLESGVVPEKLVGKIEFRNVGFSYLEGKKVLENMSFVIDGKGLYAIVGESGAGKSTAAMLMMHFYTAPEGSITIDGVDVNRYNLPALRRRIGYLASEAGQFNSTLRENLTYGNENLSDNELFRALASVGLEDFATPEGLNLNMGESARNFSAGQRLRAALARELLRRPDILILDEPTGALDASTEARVVATLKDYSRSACVVVITHRAPPAEAADRVFLVADGKVACTGGYAEIKEKVAAVTE